jgi:Flp pilus assembly protein TadG
MTEAEEGPVCRTGPVPLSTEGGDIMRKDKEKGQAMVEFALVLPIILLLLSGIIDFGWIFGNQLMADNACREAARYTAVHYYDSSADDDQAVAAGIVAEKAPTLDSSVALSVSGAGDVSTVVTGQVDLLTPFFSSFFENGQYTVTATCVMKLE